MVLNELDCKTQCVYSALDHQKVLEGLWAIPNWAISLLLHGGLAQFVGPL